jgi:pimeloyl-ACP methyl ester carboxylesterase
MRTSKQCTGTFARAVSSKARIAVGAFGLLTGVMAPVYHAAALTVEDTLYFESVGPDYYQNGIEMGAFYNVPSPLPAAAPGALIRVDNEPFTGYTGNGWYGANSNLPAGVSAYRFMYHTRTTLGRDVASTGVVFIPPGQPPRGGWPVIAWAHGTAGVARNCAPSAMKDVFYGDTDLFGFMDSANYPDSGTSNPQTHGEYPRYAVVATDYAGLGTPSRHEYLSKVAQGMDVINSVSAARAAFPSQLNRKWVVVGHSQGATAALGVAELQAIMQDPNYLGAVSIAPMTHLVDTIKMMTPYQTGYLPFISYGVKSVFPWVQYEDLMTDTALNLLATTSPLLPPAATPETQLGCMNTAGYAADGFAQFLSYGQVMRTDWGKGINNPWLNAYSELNEPAPVRANRPIFIAQGVADEVIPVALTDRAVSKLCSMGDKVLYKTYPADPAGAFPPHTWSVYQSFDHQMTWIGERFAGKSAPNNCR